MFKKYIFMSLICLYTIIVYAEDFEDNLEESFINHLLPDRGISDAERFAPSNIGTKIISESQGVQSKPLYMENVVFNYQMNQTEFSKFLTMNNLQKSMDLQSTKHIAYISIMDNNLFDILNQKLAKRFLHMEKAISGKTECYINIRCGGATGGLETNADNYNYWSSSFKTYDKNGNISVKLIVKNKFKKNKKDMSFTSGAILNNIENKNFVIITKNKRGGLLYGQIILVAFANKE